VQRDGRDERLEVAVPSHPVPRSAAPNGGGGTQVTPTNLPGTMSSPVPGPPVSLADTGGPLLSHAGGGARGDVPRRVNPASGGRTMASLRHAWPLGYLLSPHQDLSGACCSHRGASHTAEPQRLIPSLQRGRSVPLIPSLRFTAHTSEVIATPGMSRCRKRERSGRCRQSAPCLCSV
jgi:hypothetical protein